MIKMIINFLIILTSIQISFAQVKKYGKIIKQDFEIKLDNNSKTNAFVLFKKRRSYYEYDSQYGLVLITTVQERIKILNKKGFRFASKKVFFYSENNTNESVKIKAVTYNLLNDKIIKTKLKKENVFSKKTSEFWNEKSFTMPNLNKNCIVEWEYKIRSPFIYHINDFVFQDDIPVMYYRAKMIFPKELNASYEHSEFFNIKFIENEGLEMVVNNISALKKEPFTNNIENYRGTISFEITSSTFLTSQIMVGTSYKTKNLSRNWNDVTKSLFKDSRFGDELKKSNYLKEGLKFTIQGEKSSLNKIKSILKFVKNKMKWNGNYGVYTVKGVKKAYKNGTGNVAEINLILTAMLRQAGLDASPILVSTRSHGIPVFPTRKGFNYVIVGVELQSRIILLDATDEYSSPDVLPIRALNWKGRIIRKSGSSAFINLFPKVYALEQNWLSVKLDNQGNITGSLRASFKNLNALTLRHRLNNLTDESLIKKLEEKHKPIEIEKVRLSNQNELEKPFGVLLKFSADNQGEVINDKIYFSPLFFLKDEENVFKADERKYPVDFASAWLDNFDITILIPEGYKVEKLPESSTIGTENSIGGFSYTISEKENRIMLKVTTKINLPIIPFNQYQELKDFYTKKLLKMNEKVVLVKE